MDGPLEADGTAGPEIRRRYIVGGRVQGVGFRAWAVHRGRRLGLRGTVRNRADGTVEIEVAGSSEAVERMRELLSRGPGLAEVRRVTREPPTDRELPAEIDVVY